MQTQTIDCKKCLRPLEFTLAEIKEMTRPIDVVCIFCASQNVENRENK